MTKAVVLTRQGGPEVLEIKEVDLAPPSEGEVRIKHTAIGLNFIDTYHRSGLYKLAALPATIGMEGAGVVESLGAGVDRLQVGDRVAYASAPLGAYSEARNMPASRLVKIPSGIDDKTAAAAMLKGLTAQYLIRRTYHVEEGDWVLFHAAAGGVGSIAVQWLKALGAKVIGTAGGGEKTALAKDHGADFTIDYKKESFVSRVDEITEGKKVHVVYDGVGKDTFEASLDCLRPLGMMVSYGNASGPVPPFDIMTLTQKGSLYLTRPSLMTYMEKDDDYQKSAGELFDVLEKGKVKVTIGQTYRLDDIAQAHSDLENRKTTGSTVILP